MKCMIYLRLGPGLNQAVFNICIHGNPRSHSLNKTRPRLRPHCSQAKDRKIRKDILDNLPVDNKTSP